LPTGLQADGVLSLIDFHKIRERNVTLNCVDFVVDLPQNLVSEAQGLALVHLVAVT
jgi:hypothetical protein